MNILTLISIEFKKIRRSHILPVLLAAVLILWVFSVAHADTHFDMGDVGISPGNSFLAKRAIEAAPAVWELEGPTILGPITPNRLINAILSVPPVIWYILS